MLHTAVATAATVDLSPILNYGLQLAGLVLTGVVTWLGTRAATFFHVSTQSQLFQNVLGAVDRGIAYAQQTAVAKMPVGVVGVNVGNPVVASAVSYVVGKMPGTLNQLGMTPQHVADLVTARLPAASPPAA